MMQKRFVVLFVAAGLGIFGLLVLGAALRQGWFTPSESYFVTFHTAEGIFNGTPVSISGLKAGQVASVELDRDNKVRVEIRVQSKFSEHIRADSKVMLGRPFIIGEKAISITAGSPSASLMPPKSTLMGEESLEITDLLSGGRLGPYFQTFSKLLDQVRIMVEGDGTSQSVPLIALYGQANKTLKALEGVGVDLRLIRTEFASSADTKKLIHQLASSTENLGSVLQATEKSLPAFLKLSQEVSGIVPELNKTLGETVFTLQAMQRSFILSGGVKELKKEQGSPARVPASVANPIPISK